MAGIRVIGAVTATAGTPTPIYTGTVTPAVSFAITGGIATIVLNAATFPATGYSGGSQNPVNWPGAGGQQVILWGFSTATYFNGKIVTVIDNNPSLVSFRFYFANADVVSTADAGNTAPAPISNYRGVHLELVPLSGTSQVYVGDANVSSTNYYRALGNGGNTFIDIQQHMIPAERIFIDATVTGTGVMATLMP